MKMQAKKDDDKEVDWMRRKRCIRKYLNQRKEREKERSMKF